MEFTITWMDDDSNVLDTSVIEADDLHTVLGIATKMTHPSDDYGHATQVTIELSA